MKPDAKTFYLTTTLPYVNSDPHIGFALEIVQADVLVRYKASQGYKVFFNTGTDEHGVKIYRKAEELKMDTQAYVDEYAAKFKGLKELLSLWPEINFIRTTDAHHKAAAQEFWKKCAAAGDIYKKNYKIKYCVGCELEKTDSELVEGKCPIHPNLSIEIIEEENYFFKSSKYQQALLDLYEKQPNFVVPESRLNEIKSFVGRGLEDFSISRLKSKMPWGVPVPGDESQVMYVWFDALVNYISAIGWPTDEKKFNTYWPVVQCAGKDNLRQQAAMWQSMLLSAGIAPSKQIFIHGFITSGGQKMSKSLGNVIDPYKVVAEYGVDALRYYLIREIHPFEDSDFTMEKFKEVYNANLANGLGNLVSRVMKMAVSYGVKVAQADLDGAVASSQVYDKNMYTASLENFKLHGAMDEVWKAVGLLDGFIQKNEPFKKIKVDKEAAEKDVAYLVRELYVIAAILAPFLPTTAAKIKTLVENHQTPEAPLFARKD